MRPVFLALSAIAILVAQAALEAMPAVIAMREGGMGLGSALILGQAVQLGGTALGAAAAAFIVDSRAAPLPHLPGAILLGAGLILVGIQPIGDLAWVLVAHAVAGVGFGIILTAAFAGVACFEPAARPLAVATLLLALLAARGTSGAAFDGDTMHW